MGFLLLVGGRTAAAVKAVDAGILEQSGPVVEAAVDDQSLTSPASRGDPHLQNIQGQSFDLMLPGRHTLLHIPRGASAKGTLLRVAVRAKRIGTRCTDVYFRELNITGSWAEAKRPGGFRFAIEAGGEVESSWMGFGEISVKVIHARTNEGTEYLNFFTKHVGRTGLAIGGLLGEDDHDLEATPVPGCKRQVSLLAGFGGDADPGDTGSSGRASLD